MKLLCSFYLWSEVLKYIQRTQISWRSTAHMYIQQTRHWPCGNTCYRKHRFRRHVTSVSYFTSVLCNMTMSGTAHNVLVGSRSWEVYHHHCCDCKFPRSLVRVVLSLSKFHYSIFYTDAARCAVVELSSSYCWKYNRQLQGAKLHLIVPVNRYTNSSKHFIE